jgi:O-antigen/teichoic acid export membrane protein
MSAALPAAAPAPAAPPAEAGPAPDGMAALPRALAARTLAGSGWALLTLVLAMGAGLARTVVVARLVGARELGLMGIALLALGTVDAFTATGVETALVTQRGDVRRDLDAAFTVQAARGVLVAAALWLVAPLAASAFAAPGAAALVRALGAAALLRGLANPAVAVVMRRIDFARLFRWSLPEVVTGLVVAVAVALVRHDAWALVAGAVAAQAAATAASYAVLPRRPRLALSGAARLLGYGRWVGGSRLLMFLSLSADNALVGGLLGAGALGLYQLAFRVGELSVVTVTRAALQAALPAFTALRGGAPLRTGFRAVLGALVAVNAAYAALVLLLAGPVLRWALGDAWLPAVPVLRILVVATVFRTVVVVASELFHAVRRPRLTLEVNALRLVVMLATILPLLRSRGIEGVAVAVLLSTAAAAAWSLLRARGVFRRPAAG